MRKAFSTRNIVIAAILLCVDLIVLTLMFASRGSGTPAPPPVPGATADPYAGMVQVSNGAGGLIWVKLYDDVSPFSLPQSQFYIDSNGRAVYGGTEISYMTGIDVSEHQSVIDWERVAAAGIEFAMIRAGYRGYSEGTLNEDAYFKANIEGAKAAGIKTGAYFFSQAVNEDEAREEAEFFLTLLDGYSLDFPAAFDWERIENVESARSNAVSGETLTRCALIFCEAVQNAGYEPMIYLYRRLAYFDYDLSAIRGIKLWVGAIGEYPDFYYDHQMWQYSIYGRVDGIEGDVDLDMWFVR